MSIFIPVMLKFTLPRV